MPALTTVCIIISVILAIAILKMVALIIARKGIFPEIMYVIYRILNAPYQLISIYNNTILAGFSGMSL